MKTSARLFARLILVSGTLLGVVAIAQNLNAPAPDGVRKGGTLGDETAPQAMPNVVTPLKKPTRNFPEQPPTIPHTIRNYQIDLNFNQCLSCHSRQRSAETGAPMVSITHYWTRENQALAAVSPRRYFCLQCHVPQHNVESIGGGNTFRNMDAVISASAGE